VEAFAIGVDIGGTFTDCVVVGSRGRTAIGKALSTYEGELSGGVLNAISVAAERLGLGLDTLLSTTRSVYHGSTVGTNALVEGRTARVGLITTRGHGDSLFFMQAGARLRGLPPSVIAHVARQPKPPRLVEQRLVAEIDERVTFDGHALVPLNEASARAAIDKLLREGAEALAISLLWSFANPAHEQRVRELIEEKAPGMYVSLSHQIAPRPGEFQRTVATVINSLIGPVMDAYLGGLERALQAAGYQHALQLMSCTGGVISVDEARLKPVLTIGSGPTAGVIGSRTLAARLAAEDGAPINVVTTDMGGTTLDIGVIANGVPLTRATSRHGQYEYFVPTVDVRSLGAGGGSIIHFNEHLGSLTVGPNSAGSTPGPACYGRGGTEATITDAGLVLGYLDPNYFLHGRMTLDKDAALRALDRVGAPLGLVAMQVAAAAVRIVDSQMADAIRLASVQQGYDPRQFTLFAYGGCGPMHASGYARELGIRRVVIPLSDFAAGWSAFGIATSEATVVRELGCAAISPFAPAFFSRHFSELEAEVRARLLAQGAQPWQMKLSRLVDMRYRSQLNEMPIRAPDGNYGETDVAKLLMEFEREYARLYGEGVGPEGGYAITALRVKGTADIIEYTLPTRKKANVADVTPLKGTRPVLFYEHAEQGPISVPIYDGTVYAAGMARLHGPAIVEFPDTTVVIRAGMSAAADQFGNLVLSIDA
jgi:N-methylhydantoinase A